MFKFNPCRFTHPCFGGWAPPYRKARGATADVLRDDTVRLYGLFPPTWLNSALSARSHCVWVRLSWHTGNTSVGTNYRVLKVSTVQAPYRIDPTAGPYLHQFTNSFGDHQSSTPFTRHVVPPWCLPFVSLCRTMVAGFDSRVFLYGLPSAQPPSCTACAVVRFIRRDSLPGKSLPASDRRAALHKTPIWRPIRYCPIPMSDV